MAHKQKEQREHQQIRVFVRSRPLNKSEKVGQLQSVIDILNDREIVVRQAQEKRFKFYRVFGPNSTQLDVYIDVVAPLIPEVLSGYNCTVFAYGQTGTGKTYTMAGGHANCALSWKDDQLAGCIPRACINIFDELDDLLDTEYTVQVSYSELYNEELNDLLADTNSSQQLRIYEDPQQKGSVFISGLSEVAVCCREDIYKLLTKGAERRKTATTLMNHHSSRSHSIFTITVHIKELTVTGNSLIKTGKLNLVDLAGSENINRFGAKNARAREASSINQSLLTLGRVMKALVEGHQHIPYRESKLTRMLRDSLGGCTKTSIIATISPAIALQDETLNTLDYANRAQNITNTPQIHAKTLQASIIRSLRDEVEKLRKDLAATRTGSGFLIASENYKTLVEEGEKYKKSVLDEKIAIQDLQEKIKKLETDIRMKEEQLNIIADSIEATRCKVALLKEATKLKDKEARQEKFVADYYEKTSAEVAEKAKEILKIADTSSKNNNFLHRKVDTLYKKLYKNTKISENMFLVLDQNVVEIKNDLNTFATNQNDSKRNLLTEIDNLTKAMDDLLRNFVCVENELTELVQSFSSNNTPDTFINLNSQSDLYSNMINNMNRVISSQNIFIESVSTLYSTLGKISVDDINNLFNCGYADAEYIIGTVHKVFEIFKECKQSMKLFDQNMNDFKKFVNDSLQQMKNRIMSDQTKISNSFPQIERLNIGLVEVSDSLKQNIQNNNVDYMKEFYLSCNEKLEDIFKDYTTKSSSVINNVTMNLKKLDVHRNNLNASQKHKCEHINEITKQDSNFENVTNDQLSALKKFNENTIQYGKYNNITIVQLKNLVEVLIDRLSENVEMGLSSELIFSAKSLILKEFQSITKETNDFQENFMSKLESINEHLKTTYIDQLESPEHEGDTPKQSKFKYPSNFEKQLQRDVLLKEYKQTVEGEECAENDENSASLM